MSNSKKIKLVAVIGKSASGKDTIVNEFCKTYKGVHKKISTTTRPPRDYEKDGVDYFFVSGEEFAEKVLNFEMIEACDFRDWFYGTELRALDKDKINIGVFTPDGVRALLEDSRIDLYVLYIMSPDKERIIRSLKRENNPDIDEIFRRYKADKEDFSELDFQYYPIMNYGHISIDDLVHIAKERIVEKFGQK